MKYSPRPLEPLKAAKKIVRWDRSTYDREWRTLYILQACKIWTLEHNYCQRQAENVCTKEREPGLWSVRYTVFFILNRLRSRCIWFTASSFILCQYYFSSANYSMTTISKEHTNSNRRISKPQDYLLITYLPIWNWKKWNLSFKINIHLTHACTRSDPKEYHR